MSGGARRRTPAEWVTFTVATAVLIGVLAAIATEIPGSRRPPDPVARAGAAERRGERFVVPVVVENLGEQTAQDVQVQATLTIDGEDQDGDQVIDFLSGGEQEEMEFVFDDDPADGELVVRVTGHSLP